MSADKEKIRFLWKNKNILIDKIIHISKKYEEYINEIQH